MKRYDLNRNAEEWLEEPDGDWVRHDDAQAEIEAMAAEAERFRERLDAAIDREITATACTGLNARPRWYRHGTG